MSLCVAKVLPGEKVMTPAQIRGWTKHYVSAAALQKYIMGLFETEGDSNATIVLRKNIAATLAELILVVEDPVKFAEKYGELYRWELRSQPILLDGGRVSAFSDMVQKRNEPPAQQESNKVVILPTGYKLVLQLYINDKWKDWISLRKSNYRVAGYGVFAERDFPVNSILGCYAGTVTGRGIVGGRVATR